ncbi:hypothetical protein P7C70_g6064, partial [Phenoliferia sp. Uapishka_3]
MATAKPCNPCQAEIDHREAERRRERSQILFGYDSRPPSDLRGHQEAPHRPFGLEHRAPPLPSNFTSTHYRSDYLAAPGPRQNTQVEIGARAAPPPSNSMTATLYARYPPLIPDNYRRKPLPSSNTARAQSRAPSPTPPSPIPHISARPPGLRRPIAPLYQPRPPNENASNTPDARNLSGLRPRRAPLYQAAGDAD